jgi:hypothetical protein
MKRWSPLPALAGPGVDQNRWFAYLKPGSRV